VTVQQFGDGFTRSPFRTQFKDDIIPDQQILKTRTPVRLKLGDCLPDIFWVSGGHTLGR
jgi:hypothetical protein